MASCKGHFREIERELRRTTAAEKIRKKSVVCTVSLTRFYFSPFLKATNTFSLFTIKH